MILPRCLAAKARHRELSGFLHEGMFEGTGVSVERCRFESEFFSSITPVADSGEDVPEYGSGLGAFEPKARSGFQRQGDGGIFLVVRDGGLRGVCRSISGTGFKS